MEIYTDEVFAETVIQQASLFDIDARVIGRVEDSNRKELLIKVGDTELVF